MSSFVPVCIINKVMSWFKFKLPSMWSDYVSFGDYSWVMEILIWF